MGVRTRLTTAGVLLVAILAAACGAGGGGARPEGDPLEPGGRQGAGERPVQFAGAGKVRLAGTLSVPGAEAPATAPAVLILPAAGPGDRNGPAQPTGGLDPLGQDLAAAFANAGIPSYRYDRRGTGGSTLDPDTRLTLDDLVADARAGVDLVIQRKETAGRPVAVVAYDSGGLVALRLAASDDRVKRLVLISTPGQSLVEAQAATFGKQYGPESADALRATVAGLMQTRTLPPLNDLRSEFRPMLQPREAPFLADLYGLDPTTDAGRIKAQTLVVVPNDAGPYAPGRLATALPGSAILVAAGTGPTLAMPSAPPPANDADPNNMSHLHEGSGGAQVPRDAEAIGRIVAFAAGGA